MTTRMPGTCGVVFRVAHGRDDGPWYVCDIADGQPHQAHGGRVVVDPKNERLPFMGTQPEASRLVDGAKTLAVRLDVTLTKEQAEDLYKILSMFIGKKEEKPGSISRELAEELLAKLRFAEKQIGTHWRPNVTYCVDLIEEALANVTHCVGLIEETLANT